MAYNPNAIFISPSSLADFERCPQLYYFRNVYKSARGFKIQIINPYLALGQSVHDALSQFLKLPPLQRSKDELWRIFDFLWQGLSGEKGGFSSNEEERGFKERATNMLARFWGNKHFQEVEAVQIPAFPKVELGNDLILTGKLDWVEKDDQGYHIIDFKTGKSEEREDSQQLPIYSVLVSKIFGSPKIRTSFWYLDKDEEIVPFPSADLEKTISELKRKGEIVKMVRRTASFRCRSGEESCWACRDMLAVSRGKGKLVSMDPVNRKQEIYILAKETVAVEPSILTSPTPVVEDLPF